MHLYLVPLEADRWRRKKSAEDDTRLMVLTELNAQLPIQNDFVFGLLITLKAAHHDHDDGY